MPDSRIQYRNLFTTAFLCSLAMLVLIPIQIAVFVLYPVPNSAAQWFQLFHTNPLVGMLHSDLPLLIDNVLLIPIYLGFYHALKPVNRGMMQLALILGLVGIAAYLSSNKTFELLALSQRFAAANDSERSALLSVGQTLLLGWQGTAFDAYYVLNGLTLLLVSILMFKSGHYTRATAVWGLVAAVLMTVPSTAGMVGLAFSLASLVPWYVFTIRYALVFRRLAAQGSMSME